MPTLYSMVNETGNRNRILEMCKFPIWIRLSITSTILHRFSPYFACGSEVWSFRRLLFVEQTRSSLPILEMCGFRFWQFSGSGDHICQQIGTKSHVQIKFSNADFGEWNRKYKSDFRDVRIPDLVSIRYYVHNCLPIFIKFCKWLRNVVASTPIWRRGVVASVVRRMNEVTLRRARLVLGRLTVFGRVHHHGM